VVEVEREIIMQAFSGSFGKMLRQIRVDKNITLREFSRTIGYDPSNACHYSTQDLG